MLFQLVPRWAPDGALTTVLIFATPSIVGTILIVRAIERRLAPPPRVLEGLSLSGA
jgi:hypothetical protein